MGNLPVRCNLLSLSHFKDAPPPTLWSAATDLPLQYLHPSCRRSILKGMQTHPSTWITYRHENSRITVSPCVPELWCPRGHHLQLWTPFISRVWLAGSWILRQLTSRYHPQSNSQTEWKIQDIGRYLHNYCHQNQMTGQFLCWVKYAQNSLRQHTIDLMSPTYLLMATVGSRH